MSSDFLMTTEEVAQYLRCSEQTVLGWRRAGVGPPYLPCGQKYLWRKGDVDSWLAENADREQAVAV